MCLNGSMFGARLLGLHKVGKPVKFLGRCGLVIALCVWRSALAVEVDLAPDLHEYRLASAVEMLVDSERNLTIADLLEPDAQRRFVPNQKPNMNFGFSRSAYWFRLHIRNDAEVQGPWLLHIAHPPLDRVEFYLVQNGSIRGQRTTGDLFSFATRDLPNSDFVFRLPEPLPKAVTVYLRVESEGSVIVPLTLWRGDAFIVDQNVQKQILGIYYGIILAIILYNLFLFFSIREITYAYYVSYLSCMLTMQMVLEGLAAEHFWPSAPAWNNYSVIILLGLVNIFGLLFARSFLDLKKILARMDNVLVTMGVAMVTIMLSASVISYHNAILAAIGMSVVISVTILFVALLLLKQGNRQVRFLLLAYGALFPGVVLLILGSLDWVEVEALSKHALKVGTALDAILLSFGLADRIKTLAWERETARREADLQRDRALTLQREFARKLLDSQEYERRRIAGELHDGLGQNLLVIVNQIRRFMERQKLRNKDLAQVADLAAQSVEETREIAHALHPHILDRLGLTKAIESAIKRGLREQGVAVDASIGNIDNVLPKPHQIHLYRIMQESFSNIVKHAKATHCLVSIESNKNNIHIKVEDDGVGLPEGAVDAEHRSGLGLTGIVERANMIGGRVVIGSREGGGTTLLLDIDL